MVFIVQRRFTVPSTFITYGLIIKYGILLCLSVDQRYAVATKIFAFGTYMWHKSLFRLAVHLKMKMMPISASTTRPFYLIYFSIFTQVVLLGLGGFDEIAKHP